jgi:hypothetical protein
MYVPETQLVKNRLAMYMSISHLALMVLCCYQSNILDNNSAFNRPRSPSELLKAPIQCPKLVIFYRSVGEAAMYVVNSKPYL